jgi:hypothetical protein
MLETQRIEGVKVEYRLWITIPDLPLLADRSEPFMQCMDREFAEFGPVFTGAGNGLVAIIALDAADEAQAATLGVGIISDALHRVGFEDHYPAAIEVEEVSVEDAELYASA